MRAIGMMASMFTKPRKMLQSAHWQPWQRLEGVGAVKQVNTIVIGNGHRVLSEANCIIGLGPEETGDYLSRFVRLVV